MYRVKFTMINDDKLVIDYEGESAISVVTEYIEPAMNKRFFAAHNDDIINAVAIDYIVSFTIEKLD